MDGVNGNGSDAEAYGDDGGYGDNGGYSNNDGNYGEDSQTRDFLSQQAAFNAGAFTSYSAYAHGFAGPSNPSPSHLGVGALDLNAGQGWAGMNKYASFLGSGAEYGGVGGSGGPPPVRVPSGTSTGPYGLRAPAPRQRGGPVSVPRARGARRRAAQPAVPSDTDDVPALQVPVKASFPFCFDL
jgi:hypothetical protein